MGRGLDGCLLPELRPCAVFKLHRGGLANFPVVHSERETPLPIPNRAVKPLSADGTWRATSWESRSPPVFLQARDIRRGPFSCLLREVVYGGAPRTGAACLTGPGAALAGACGGPCSRLEAVLAEGGEIDRQVDRIGYLMGD